MLNISHAQMSIMICLSLHVCVCAHTEVMEYLEYSSCTKPMKLHGHPDTEREWNIFQH